MNFNMYVNVLKDHLLPFYVTHESAFFLHGGAPCQRAKQVKNWLAEKEIEMVDWLGHSPDLNPTEKVWNQIKSDIEELLILSADALAKKIQNSGHKLIRLTYINSQTVCQTGSNLFQSEGKND